MSGVGAQCWSEIEQQAVRTQLDRILNSGPFQQSQRRKRFLQFLVDETLAGQGDRLKGYTIAVEVFDRPQSFDPAIDPVVRVEAGRLREKLRDYYDGEGSKDPIRIDLPKGTYGLHFEFCRVADDTGIAASSPDEMATTPPDKNNEVQSFVGKHSGLLRSRRALIATALVVLIGAIGWWVLGPRLWPASASGPRGPVIAVLPFTNLSGDPAQEYFSDGLTEDILTELSRTRDLTVLASNTTFQFKGQPVDLAKFSRDYKADYVLQGGIQRSNSRIRITSQLIETGTSRQVWADRFDRQIADLLVVQDEIASEIVAKLTGGYGVIEVAESKSSKDKHPGQVEAYDLILRARDAMRAEWSRQTFGTAKTYLRQAIDLDHDNSRALRELAYLSAVGWVFHFDPQPASQNLITAQAVRSVQLAPDDPRARMVAAASYFWTNQLDLFDREAREALSLAPNDAEILATIGTMYAKSGQWARGLALLEKANALNDYAASGWYQSTVGVDAYLKGDYQRALAMLRQSSDQGTFYIYLEYIPVYGQLGRKVEAQAAWRKLLQEEPAATSETFLTWFKLWNMRDEDTAKLMDGVRKSGVLDVADKSVQ